MDYFGQPGRRQTASSNPQNRNSDAPSTPGARRVAGAPSFESLRTPSNIRIRRLLSNTPTTPRRAPSPQLDNRNSVLEDDETTAGRRRSFSAPQRPPSHLASIGSELTREYTTDGTGAHMSTITEGQQMAGMAGPLPSRPTGFSEQSANVNVRDSATRTPSPERLGASANVMHSAGNAAQRTRGHSHRLSRIRSTTSFRHSAPVSAPNEDEYESDIIDLLDLVDPEIQTLGTLTNLQNSLFVPDLGGLVNRRPTYQITRRPTSDIEAIAASRARADTRSGLAGSPSIRRKPVPDTAPASTGADIELQDAGITRKMSISSELSDSHYAVLPHGVSLQGWADEDVAELNDHVRHMLHSKREGFRRSMRGFRQYVSKPLGLFVTIYATLVTLFGAAWVFALIGWIYVADRQEYIINVIDLVLVALFALMGDGLAPFRAVDTYHMFFIAHYHHLTWKLRKKQGLPRLVDHNDLPDRRMSETELPGRLMSETDLDDLVDKEEMAEFSVLSAVQQRRLQYHQAKFNKSHTFYKPHETSTHHAFPLKMMVAAVVLLDCHSLLQVALGTCTWSIDYRVRPEALTATILSCSIACNVAAGVVISIGDHKTRKKDVLERMFRQGLTEEALKRMAKKHQRGDMMIGVNQNQVESQDIKQAAEAAVGTSGTSASRGAKQDNAYVTPPDSGRP